MAHRKRREPGPQHHAEGQHGEKTHRAFIEQLQQAQSSEKVEAMREVNQRGHVDDDVLKHARIPHEGDSV